MVPTRPSRRSALAPGLSLIRIRRPTIRPSPPPQSGAAPLCCREERPVATSVTGSIRSRTSPGTYLGTTQQNSNGSPRWICGRRLRTSRCGTEAPDRASANALLLKSNTNGTFAGFPSLLPSTIGASEVSPPNPLDTPPERRALVTVGTDRAPLNGIFEVPFFKGGDSYYALVHELGHLIGL